jgi:hypothetical protein
MFQNYWTLEMYICVCMYVYVERKMLNFLSQLHSSWKNNERIYTRDGLYHLLLPTSIYCDKINQLAKGIHIQ